MRTLKILSLFAAATLVACASMRHDRKDIVETAVADGRFETLVTALKAADLVETLKGPGPFTVFAPTDDAFAKLPDGTVQSLLRPENRKRLTDILTYHVVSGSVEAEQAMKLSSAKTVQGKPLRLRVVGGELKVNDATVVIPDIQCENGVIHVVDTVLLPR